MKFTWYSSQYIFYENCTTQLYLQNYFLATLHLHHHQMNHHPQQASRLQNIIWHATNHLNRYQTDKITLIQIPVCQILLCRIHLTHQNPGVLNKYYVHIRNVGLNGIPTTLFKKPPSLHPNYLKLRTIPRSLGLNRMRFLYCSGFISWISWIPLKLSYHNLSRVSWCLWNILP